MLALAFYPGAPPPPARRGGVSTALVIAGCATVAVLVTVMTGGLGLYLFHLRSSVARATASPSVAAVEATSGFVVFSDDFHDSTRGWYQGTLTSGTTIEYGAAHLIIVGKENLLHFEMSPYNVPRMRLSSSVTATQDAGALNGAGFGATCVQEQDLSDQLRYSFLVETGGGFVIERTNGPDSPTNTSIVVERGTAAAEPGPTALTVVGDCVTASDYHSTRLILFVDGQKVADMIDYSPAPSRSGWLGGLVTHSVAAATSTVTITKFEERDLSTAVSS